VHQSNFFVVNCQTFVFVFHSKASSYNGFYIIILFKSWTDELQEIFKEWILIFSLWSALAKLMVIEGFISWYDQDSNPGLLGGILMCLPLLHLNTLRFFYKNWGVLDTHSHGVGVTKVNTPYLNPATCLSLQLGISKST